MDNNGTILAVCGKGGVGKTSISAMLVRHFSRDPKNRVLAIDADPAVGLATALGIDVGKTVDDIRNELIRRVTSGEAPGRAEMLSMLDYEMFSALRERENLAFLAIGRPEKEGCYCQVNHILKDVIASVAENFDFVVIDGEAGIEQVNRRVMETVTHLILVSDASTRGINVACTIKSVAETAVGYQRAGLIFNRIRDAAEYSRLTIPAGIDCLGWLPEDDSIRETDIQGGSILYLADTPAVRSMEKCLEALGLGDRTSSTPGRDSGAQLRAHPSP